MPGRFKKGDRVEIEWEDSSSVDGWTPAADIIADRGKKTRCYSAGWVLADDKRGIALAASVHRHQVSGVIIIPKSAIRKRRRLDHRRRA